MRSLCRDIQMTTKAPNGVLGPVSPRLLAS